MKKIIVLILALTSLCHAQNSIAQQLTALEASLPAESYHALYQQYESICLLLQTMPAAQRTALEEELVATIEKAATNRSAADLHNQLRLIQELRILPEAFSHPASMYWQQYPGSMPLHMMPQMEYFTPVWRAISIIGLCGLLYLGVKALKNHAAGKDVRKHKLKQHRDGDKELVNACFRPITHALLRGHTK